MAPAMTGQTSGTRKPKLLICIAAVICALSGCTAMLLGGGNSDGTRLGGDSRSATQVSADRAINSAVRNRLLDDSVLGRYDLRIETVDRRVILYGTVGSYEARERAIRLAGTVEGVERVDSRLRVGGGT
jgi:hyperosmotically inducible periplasmic protein